MFMTVFLLTLCFAVVIWSAFNHLRYLGIDADYLISGGRRLQFLWYRINALYTKVLSVSLQAGYGNY